MINTLVDMCLFIHAGKLRQGILAIGFQGFMKVSEEFKENRWRGRIEGDVSEKF